MMVERIQRRRAKGWRMPANTVYVGRPGPFGNPFHNWYDGDDFGPEVGARYFRRWLSGEMTAPELFQSLAGHKSAPAAVLARHTIKRLHERREVILGRIRKLRGKNLACWCPPACACHADVLLELANGTQGHRDG